MSSHSSSQVTQEQILETLKTIKFPGLSRDIVSFGLIKGVEVDKGVVQIKVVLKTKDENIPQKIENEINAVTGKLSGVKEVQIEMNWTKPQEAAHHDPHALPDDGVPLLPGVKVKIAVASGKGGVGKSTVAAGLALMLQKRGQKVGLVDFDIYGPSVPTIMGINTKPLVKDHKIVPLDCNGMKLMSMGFLVDPGTPMIWRGPMVHQATEQFLRDVDWGELDILVVDLPPGTGDAQMTLSQKIQLDGVVIVSTPQDLALIDARKGVAMFQTMNVPILGIVENMSGFRCPHCKEITYIFGRNGAAKEAVAMNIPLLAKIPLVPAIVEAFDKGEPFKAIEADPELLDIFSSIAGKVLTGISLSA